MKRLLLIPVFLALAAIAGEDTIPKPIDFGSKEISICVAVPNLQTLIDNAETFLKPILGDALQPGQFKVRLGAALGDAELAGVELDKPAVFALFKSPPIELPNGEPPPWALFLPAKSADAFAAVLNKAGLQSSFDNNLLIVAKTADALKKAQDQKALYAKIADAKIKSDGRVYLNVNALLETYMPLLKTQFNIVLPLIGMAFAIGKPDADPIAIQKMIKMGAKIGRSAISQIDVIQHDISFKPESLQIETLYAAKDGTPLFGLLSAPPAGKSKTLGLLSTAGMMTAVIRFDPAKFSAASSRFIDDLSRDPMLAEVLDEPTKAFVKQTVSVFAGEFATSTAIVPDTGIDQEAACTAADEKAYMDMLEKTIAQLKPDGALGKLYASLGMKMSTTLDKNVREHSKVSVSRRKMEFDAAGMTPEQAAGIKAMAKDADIAITNGVFLSANRPEALDTMIDKLLGAPKKDIELKSIQTFGEGKQIYLDADWSGMIQGVLSLQPNNPAARLFARMKSAEPVAMAGSFDNGRLLLQANIPTAPFTDLAAAIRPIMLLRGQRKAQRPPQPPPPDKKNNDF